MSTGSATAGFAHRRYTRGYIPSLRRSEVEFIACFMLQLYGFVFPIGARLTTFRFW